MTQSTEKPKEPPKPRQYFHVVLEGKIESPPQTFGQCIRQIIKREQDIRLSDLLNKKYELRYVKDLAAPVEEEKL